MKVTLKFLGMDSWDHPVYVDENGTLWKDVNPRRAYTPDLCIAVGNQFDGEPDTNMCYLKKYDEAELVFTPERVAWD